MKHVRMVSTIGLCLAAAYPALARAEADPSGVWMRGDGNAKVRIAPCGSDICATNLWIGDTSGGESTGDKLIMKLKPNGDSALEGTAYDPQRDLNYSIKVTVKKNALTTRGCVVGGLICKNVNWTKAE